jgi:hypothetical protein
MKSINNPWKHRDSELSVWSGTKGYDDDDDDDDNNNNNNNDDNDEFDKNKKKNEDQDETEVDTRSRKPFQESCDLYDEDDKKELERLFRILDSEGIIEGVRILEESEESVSKKSFLSLKHDTKFEHGSHKLRITSELRYIRDRRCDVCKVSHCQYRL